MTSADWQVDISAAAAADIREIAAWTRRRFGGAQAVDYGEVLKAALVDLRDGPGTVGARRRDDIGVGYGTFHIARHGRRGRHFILFRVVDASERIINVVRILHDSMDMARHLPPNEP